MHKSNFTPSFSCFVYFDYLGAFSQIKFFLLGRLEHAPANQVFLALTTLLCKPSFASFDDLGAFSQIAYLLCYLIV